MKRQATLTGIALISVAACVAVPLATPASAPRVTPDSETGAQHLRGKAHQPRAGRMGEPNAPRQSDPHALEVEESPHKSKAALSRHLDRGTIEARGADLTKGELDPTTLAVATTFNNKTWTGARRQELLAYLRRRSGPPATFVDDDARAIALIQRGSGAEADGKLRDETMAVLLAAGFRFAARKEALWRTQIDFYPGELEDLPAWDEAKIGRNYRTIVPPKGEGVLYVRSGGAIVTMYRARGGPPWPLQDPPKHVADPTTPGSFKLGPPHVHVTNSWENSQIPWGAEIRKQEDGYQFRWPSTGAWQWATARDGPTLETPLENGVFEDLTSVSREGQTMLLWTKNDFGPKAWQLVPTANYVHTTPAAEAAALRGLATVFAFSHGCVHVDPRERDEMVERGYLKPEVSFVVHTWTEHVLPDMVRSDMLHGVGAAAFELTPRESSR